MCDENLISDAVRVIERNSGVLLFVYKDINIAVNIGNAKYVEIGRYFDMVPNVNITVSINY